MFEKALLGYFVSSFGGNSDFGAGNVGHWDIVAALITFVVEKVDWIVVAAKASERRLQCCADLRQRWVAATNVGGARVRYLYRARRLLIGAG